MKTNLIYSNSKHGAFIAIMEELKKNLSSHREQIVIVPDKFSLNAEKYIMEYLGLESTTFINVSSLDRMADNYCKSLNLEYLSKFGGIMLVQKILVDNLSKLNVFKKSYRYSDFSENLFNNIMLLKSCNVSYQDLMNKVEQLEDFSRFKMQEIAFIYEEYENSLKERFYDSANKLTILKNNLISNSYQNTDFYYAIGGDFNIGANCNKKQSHRNNTLVSSLIREWSNFVCVDVDYPEDQNHDCNTNRGRKSHYDWVLVDSVLQENSVPVKIGDVDYPNGYVLDSRVQNPLSDICPVEYGDSESTNMQHMAVIRDFIIQY